MPFCMASWKNKQKHSWLQKDMHKKNSGMHHPHPRNEKTTPQGCCPPSLLHSARSACPFSPSPWSFDPESGREAARSRLRTFWTRRHGCGRAVSPPAHYNPLQTGDPLNCPGWCIKATDPLGRRWN
ncbi:unnamed protein product [Durusdinium trenchii]|uniref:Uncharacterized protein n=1 Tax=Durusdinium trenchii TaxID=1381693 RepID=A0ABP0HIR2_9DINO